MQHVYNLVQSWTYHKLDGLVLLTILPVLRYLFFRLKKKTSLNG